MATDYQENDADILRATAHPTQIPQRSRLGTVRRRSGDGSNRLPGRLSEPVPGTMAHSTELDVYLTGQHGATHPSTAARSFQETGPTMSRLSQRFPASRHNVPSASRFSSSTSDMPAIRLSKYPQRRILMKPVWESNCPNDS